MFVAIAIAAAIGFTLLASTPAAGPTPPPVGVHKRVDHEGLATNRRFVYWLFQAPDCPSGSDVFCTPGPSSE